MNNENKKELKLSEIEKDYTMSIVATLEGKKVDLPIQYANLSEEESEEVATKYGPEAIPLDPIVRKWEEKIFEVSFKGHTSKLELIVVTTEDVFHWSSLKIFKVKLTDGRSINILTSNLACGVRFNRRRGVRITLDKMMTIEQGDQSFLVIVRDLSYCGVGFFEPGSAKVQRGMPFTLKLTESSDDGDKLVCKLTGKILHQREEEGGIVSGCVLSSQHAAFLQRYIAIKQMEQISGRKQDYRVEHNATGDDWKNKVVNQLNRMD